MRASLKRFAAEMSRKISYPSAERNKGPILEVLRLYLSREAEGKVLEIASGTGQHSAHFAPHFPNLVFQPTEHDRGLFESIRAYARDTPMGNIKEPVFVDVAAKPETWGLDADVYDYLINVNMIHISPFRCTVGLFENACSLLKAGGMLVTYGPYAKDGKITPQSNVDFDRSLRAQDPEWGLRDIADLKKIAGENGMALMDERDLPANNKCLVWKKLG